MNARLRRLLLLTVLVWACNGDGVTPDAEPPDLRASEAPPAAAVTLLSGSMSSTGAPTGGQAQAPVQLLAGELSGGGRLCNVNLCVTGGITP